MIAKPHWVIRSYAPSYHASSVFPRGIHITKSLPNLEAVHTVSMTGGSLPAARCEFVGASQDHGSLSDDLLLVC